jgi:hypothetical protein
LFRRSIMKRRLNSFLAKIGQDATAIRGALTAPLTNRREPIAASTALMVLGFSIIVQVLAYQAYRLDIPASVRRPYEVAVSSEVKDPNDARREVQARLDAHTRAFSASIVQRSIQSTVVTAFIWSAIGLVAFRCGLTGIRGAFSAVAVASLVEAAAFLLRLALMWLPFGIDPGNFALAPLFGASWLSGLGALSPVWIWWALVLAGGLARAWHAPVAVLAPVVVALTASKVMFPTFWHRVQHLVLQPFGVSN